VLSITVRVLRFLDRQEEPPHLVDPADIAVVDGGGIYVADPGAHRVFRVTGKELDVLAGTGTDGAQGAAADGAPAGAKPAGDSLAVDLGEPAALVVRDGEVYVADRELGSVLWLHDEQRLDPLPGAWQAPQRLASGSGDELYVVIGPTVAGTGPAQVVVAPGAGQGAPRPVEALRTLAAEPVDIDGLQGRPDGTLYYWLAGQGLYALAPGGSPERLVDATGDERYEVADLAVDESGDMAIAEPGAQRVTVFRPDRGIRRQVDLPFPPAALAFAGDGSIVVLYRHDPERVFLYRIAADNTVEPIGPGAARAQAGDRLTSATTTTPPTTP
jgi:hypothetical protein